MNKNLSQNPITVANASGFPLQIALANVVNKSSRWGVFLEEHPWQLAGAEGFIDLVVADKVSRFENLVIECKRVRQTGWTFLLSKSSSPNRSHAKIFGTYFTGSKWEKFGWYDLQPEPGTYESQYCSIPGQDGGRKNLIDRTASELAFSVEALAFQEKLLREKSGKNNPEQHIYVPVIVTTAKLFIAEVDPSQISLEDGCLPKDTSYSEVPFIRYKKSLSTITETSSGESIGEFHAESKRTVFIVNASNFESFLQQFDSRE